MARIGRSDFVLLAGISLTALGVASAIDASREAVEATAPSRPASSRALALAPMVARPSRAKHSIMTCSTVLTAVSPCTVSTAKVRNSSGLKQIFTITNKILN